MDSRILGIHPHNKIRRINSFYVPYDIFPYLYFDGESFRIKNDIPESIKKKAKIASLIIK